MCVLWIGGLTLEEDEKRYYKEKISEMINGINSISILKYIYSVISAYLKSRGF